MSSTRTTAIYWTTTGLFAALMLWSAYNFYFNPEMRGAFGHLGLPNYFRIELTIAKTLGALALVLPGVPSRIREFAYFGFAITVVSAIVAHSASGDGIAHVIDPLVVLGVLVASYVCHHKRLSISGGAPARR